MNSAKKAIKKIASLAKIEINGQNPWDIQIHNEKFYSRVLSGGSLAFGESYMDGWWDCDKLDEFITKIKKADIENHLRINLPMIFTFLKARIINLQSHSRAFQIGEKHYDNGNILYKAMLDKRLTYTCGYWKKAKNLDSAQEAKLDLVCKKLGLKKGDEVLDIGCGWGSFLKYAVEKYGIKGVGVTVSREQVKLAKKLCKGLDIKIKFQDYRQIHKKFDYIISLGMIEHVGVKNYKKYMKVVYNNLKPNGLFLLQTIGSNKSVKNGEPWTSKYIFPNSMLPSLKQIGAAIENIFVMEDWHNFSIDYDKTLMAWYKNFENNWDKLKTKYSERFHRMWGFYLLSSAGFFRSREGQVWQILFSKGRDIPPIRTF
jgi:cyclopropane-fatty-acyl-phospholipid synthase